MTAIADLDLTDRVKNLLTENGLETAEQVSALTDEELDLIDGIGPSSIEAIRGAIAVLGSDDEPEKLTLEPDIDPMAIAPTPPGDAEKVAIALETLTWIHGIYAEIDQVKRRPEPSGITVRLAKAIAQIGG